MSAPEAFEVLEGEPELVVEEPEPEVEDVAEDEEDEEEVLEEVDLRLAELTVVLELDELLPAEPVGTMTGVTGVTKVEFWPAGTIAAGA